jgi:predicted ATPase/class 3 adenylate cyclase
VAFEQPHFNRIAQFGALFIVEEQMERPAAYLPTDRLRALARGTALPEQAAGAALFADISGFTPLTEALVLALGPQRGAEELPRQLNLVYDALIAEVSRYGGSVLSFSGDAITCWFDDSFAFSVLSFELEGSPTQNSAALRATTCALALQVAMRQFASIAIPGAGTVALAVKVSVASGTVRRFVVGDPAIQLIDVLAGTTLDRLASGEHLAAKGDVILDALTVAALGEQARLAEWREDSETGERFAALAGLATLAAADAPPPLTDDVLPDELLKPWLLPPVYARLESGLGDFLTELRPATALFLRFGGIDFDDDPSAALKLDGFVRWVQRVLRAYEAHLLQLTIGDKGCYLYAAFGAPIAHEDDTVRACAAALELREPRFDFITSVQIGISQGRMRTGAYGALERRTYGVLGDEVNMAARLMQHAPVQQAIVSLAARRLTGDRFAWEQLPPLRVKGKSQPATVFRLIGTEERRAFRLREPRYGLPMVGRAAELAAIAEDLARARRGQGRIVGVTAEAGLGKSRLIAEAIRLADRDGVEVYGGECLSHGTTTSYLVWRSIWRGVLGLDPTQSTEEQLGALTVQLARLDPSLLPRLPLLEAVLNIDLPDNELTAAFEPKLRKTALESLLLACLRATTRQSPLLIVLEDTHWIDPLSDDLLDALGSAVADLPVLIVAAYRPPQLARVEALGVSRLAHFRELTLTSLPPDEVAELIRLKLGQLFDADVPPPEALIARINTSAQGNPFYVEELLNYLRDRNLDPRDQAVLARIELPLSLHSLILSRIDQLSEQQKSLIKVASVIGRLFRASILWGLSSFSAQQAVLRLELDTLSEMDLVPLDTPDPELTYLFKHVVTQEVAYESLPFATRAILHGQIGEVIEGRYAAEIDRMLDLLAYHFDRSELTEKRRLYLLRAAEAARRDYANDAAIDYYRRALPLLDEADQSAALIALGKVLELTGAWDDAAASYREALALAERRGNIAARARAEVAIADLLRRQGEYGEATSWAERARAAFEQAGDQAGLAQSLNIAGIIADLQADYEVAAARYEASLAIWRTLGDQAQSANLLSNLGSIASSLGDYQRALALQQEALALRRVIGDRWRIAFSLTNLGNALLDQGDHTAAAAHQAEALDLVRQIGDRWMVGNILNNLANALRTAGALTEARSRYQESLTIYREFDDQWALAYLFEDVGALAALEGRAERALRLVGAGGALRATIGAPLAPAEQERLSTLLTPAREALTPEERESALALGRALELQRAIAYALED